MTGHEHALALAIVGAMMASLACSGGSDADDGAEESTASGGSPGLVDPIGQDSGGSASNSGGSASNSGGSGGSGGSSAATSDGDGSGGSGSGGTESSNTTSDSGGTSSSGGTSATSGGSALETCPSALCSAGTQELSCCARERVFGGTFSMGRSESGSDACPDGQACPDAETPEHSASVTTFELDVFEATVGRFRLFLEAYDDLELEAGSGAHPLIEDSGWRSEWNAELPQSRGELEELLACDSDATYSAESGAADNLPINCVSWFEAFAFCVYAGGRLPTEAEWEYAAAGGSQERLYPWGDSAPTSDEAAFYPQDLGPVGSAPQGVGRWGHQDLAGSLWEWGLDVMDTSWYSGGGDPCEDCARLGSGSHRVLRGGAYSFEAVTLRAATRSAEVPGARESFIGVRCAAEAP